MSSEKPKIAWECSYCGTRNEHEVDFSGLFCEMCGTNELESVDFAARYDGLVKTNLANLPAEFFSFPFREDASASANALDFIRTRFPQFANTGIWSGFTVFDLFLIASAKHGIEWELPFDMLPERVWDAIWPCCALPAFFVKRFISSRSVKWLESAVKAGRMSVEDLRQAVAIYSRQDWFEVRADVQAEFTAFLGRLVAEKPEFADVVSSMPNVLQFELWLQKPDCRGIPGDLLQEVGADTVVKLMADASRRRMILKSYPFARFSPKNWRQALRIVSEDPDGRFKDGLWEAWEDLRLENGEIYSILSENPPMWFLLPLDRFSPDQFVHLLANTCGEDWDIASYCPFEKFSNRDWVQLLSNRRIRISSSIIEAVARHGVSAKLSKADIVRILDSNPGAAICLDSREIPVDKAVDLYLDPDKANLVDMAAFLTCRKELARSLLCRCGDRVPPCAFEMLRTGSVQAFSSKEVEEIICQNPSVAMYVPRQRIGELNPEVFCDFAVKLDGARFWTNNYDLSRLDHAAIKKLIQLYPWVSERVDISGWTYDEVADLAQDSPVILDRLPSRFGYFCHVHKAVAWFMLFCCGLVVVALLVAAFAGKVGSPDGTGGSADPNVVQAVQANEGETQDGEGRKAGQEPRESVKR